MLRSWAFTISTIVYATALAWAPSGVAQKSQFFLPTVNGRILRKKACVTLEATGSVTQRQEVVQILLIQEDNTILFVQDRLDPVMAPPAEEEQGIIVFAHMELLFDDGTEAVDLFSHISTAAYDVDGIHPADIR